MSKLLRDEKPFEVTFEDLKKKFGPESDFHEANGYFVDFKRPLEFRLPESQFRPDPLNEGKLLAPKNFTVPTVYTKTEKEQSRVYQYYVRKAVHSYNKGTLTRDVLEPNSIVFKDGRFSVDLINDNVKNYSLAYFLLNHPRLGTTFNYYSQNVQAEKLLARERQESRIRGMLTDPDHNKYLSEAAVREMARKGQIPGSDTLTDAEIRANLLSLGKRNPVQFFSLQGDTKVMQTLSLIQDAKDWGIICYDGTEKAFYMLEEKSGSEGKIRLYAENTKIYTLKLIEQNKPEVSFASWLCDFDTDSYEIVIRHALSKAKEQWKATAKSRAKDMTVPVFSLEKIS
ncbi:MAG TPA: hypothetical protein PLJ00_05840 [Chitinophagales bacterium]|nr:hypothetical protein [Chitinophagales bacterium]